MILTYNPEKMHFIFFVCPLMAMSEATEDHMSRGGSYRGVSAVGEKQTQ